MNENPPEFSDLMERDVVSYLMRHRKEWLSPSTIAREAGMEHDLQYNFYRVKRFLEGLFRSKWAINGERVEHTKIKSTRSRYRWDPPGVQANTIRCEVCHEDIEIRPWEEAVCTKCNITYRLMKDPDYTHMIAEGLVKKDLDWIFLGAVGVFNELMEMLDPLIKEWLKQTFKPQGLNH